MTDIPSLPYADVWGRAVDPVGPNLTRAAGHAFLEIVPRVPVRRRTTTFPLREANAALDALRAGRFEGAAVLVPGEFVASTASVALRDL